MGRRLYDLRYVDSANIGCSLKKAQGMEVDEVFRRLTDGIESPCRVVGCPKDL